MCQAREQTQPVQPLRNYSFEKLDQLRERVGSTLKGKGAAARNMRDKGVQADVHAPLQSRMLLPSLAVLAFCLLLNQVGLFVPVVMIVRNCILPKTPQAMRPAYPSCTDEMLSGEMTIVVSVKDACSQAPGFIRGLEVFAPPEVHLIYTFPNFESCAKIDLRQVLSRWRKVTLLPLPLRVSPMQGWVDAIPHIKTRYSMLLHNDGYALDSFFGCELLQSLKYHQVNSPNRCVACVRARRACTRRAGASARGGGRAGARRRPLPPRRHLRFPLLASAPARPTDGTLGGAWLLWRVFVLTVARACVACVRAARTCWRRRCCTRARWTARSPPTPRRPTCAWSRTARPRA